MPLPLLPLLAAAPGIFKGITGLIQGNREVQRTDTTPQAFKEQLANLRAAAGSNRLPGMGGLQDRLAQIQSGATQNARIGAASSGDFLAAAGAADARRQQGEQQLGVQQQQYHDQATRALNQGLAQQAQYQQADERAYNQANAALKGSALTNLFGGLSDVASSAIGTGVGNGAGAAASALARQAADAERGEGGDLAPITPAVAMPAPVGLPTTLPNLMSPNGAPNLNNYRFGLNGGRYAGRNTRYGF